MASKNSHGGWGVYCLQVKPQGTRSPFGSGQKPAQRSLVLVCRVQGPATNDRHTNPFIFHCSTIAALSDGAECMGPYCSPQGPPQKPPGNLQQRFMLKDSKWAQTETLRLSTCLFPLHPLCASYRNSPKTPSNFLDTSTQVVIKT